MRYLLKEEMATDGHLYIRLGAACHGMRRDELALKGAGIVRLIRPGLSGALHLMRIGRRRQTDEMYTLRRSWTLD
jgi:hypothetical protein